MRHVMCSTTALLLTKRYPRMSLHQGVVFSIKALVFKLYNQLIVVAVKNLELIETQSRLE